VVTVHEPTSPLRMMVLSTPSPIIFSYLITEKLSNTNFLIWKQVECVIKIHHLYQYVVNPLMPWNGDAPHWILLKK